MFATLQFIGVLLLMSTLIVFYRRFVKRPPVIVLGLCVILIVAAVFSAGLLATIPMATEQITVTVLSDSNPNSTGSEIVLSSVVSDGKAYHLSEPVEGNWICEGNSYRWSDLPETSGAESITHSVTFEVPIGGGRNLIFVGGPNRGKIEVSYNGSTNIYDLYRSAEDDVRVSFGATDKVYDNFIKILRLILFAVFIIVIMIIPIIITCKYKFEKYDSFFKSNFKRIIKTASELFGEYKLECILCFVSVTLSFFTFVYMDLNSLSAWSIETMDAIFRGGFTGFNEINDQNLWQAYHGVNGETTFLVSNFLWGIWNLPILFIHYLFKTDYVMTPAAMLWAKVFLEIWEIATAVVCYKIVKKATADKGRALLSFILAIGSATVFWGVGYSGENDIFYMFFLLLGLYDAIAGRKNRALIWMAIALFECPIMFIFTTIIIISLSDKLRETIVRLGISIVPIILSMILVVGKQNDFQILRVFGISTMPVGLFSNGKGNASIFTIFLVIVIMAQFFIKRRDMKNRQRIMLYSLCVVSMAFYLFSYTHFHRYQILTLLIIICIMAVENRKEMITAVAGLCIYEYGYMVLLTGVHNNYFNFKWMHPAIQQIFNSESLPNVSLYNYISYSIPDLTTYWQIICGAIIAVGIWIIYVCCPNRKNNEDREIVSPIPLRVLTTAFVSSSLILTLCIYFFAFKMDYTNVGYSDQVSEAIDGVNCVEEYYRGKSANWVRVVFRPVTNGNSYPKSQKLNLDIIDAESGEIVGMGSCSASDFKDKTDYALKIDNVDLKKDRWYIFRYYSPAVIKDEKNYMYLLYSKAGTSDPERHYAITKNNADAGEYIPQEYDIGGEILTS